MRQHDDEGLDEACDELWQTSVDLAVGLPEYDSKRWAVVSDNW